MGALLGFLGCFLRGIGLLRADTDRLKCAGGAFITPLDPNWPEPKRPMQARSRRTSVSDEPGRIPTHDQSPNTAANSLPLRHMSLSAAATARD